MPVLDRTELEASPLADLHAIANELGVDGYRLLRRDDLIEAILGGDGGLTARDLRSAAGGSLDDDEDELDGTAPRTRRATGSRRTGERAGSSRRRAGGGERTRERPSGTRASTARSAREPASERTARTAEGVVELRDGGSAFLRVDPPGPSDDDVYISPAQVKRCELSTGDRVSGPVRMPRRSERHASLARVETINGVPADEAVQAPEGATSRAEGARASRGEGARGTRGEGTRAGSSRGGRSRSARSAEAGSARETSGTGAEAPGGPAFPDQLLAFPLRDEALSTVQRLAPVGFGSRAVIVGDSRAGKSELLRRMLQALGGRSDIEVALVLVGVRPEEVPEWEAGPIAPAATLTFEASADSQGQAVERALAKAERSASKGDRAVVLIDSLDGLDPQTARKALASARNIPGAGSLTVIGTAARPLGGETTVIALDASLAGTGHFPAIDVMASGTLRPELLVGADGAQAITQARAEHERRTSRKRRFWRR